MVLPETQAQAQADPQLPRSPFPSDNSSLIRTGGAVGPICQELTTKARATDPDANYNKDYTESWCFFLLSGSVEDEWSNLRAPLEVQLDAATTESEKARLKAELAKTAFKIDNRITVPRKVKPIFLNRHDRILPDNYTLSQGQRREGILQAKGGGKTAEGQTIMNVATISGSTSNVSGIWVKNRNKVKVINKWNGVIRMGMAENANATQSHGMFLEGFGLSVVNQDNATIETGASSSSGILIVGDNATVNNLNTATIRATGRDSRGISVIGNNARINNLDHAKIRTEQDNSPGIRVDGGNARIDNVGSIATTGDRSHGIHVINGENTVILNSGTITTTGARAHGIFLQGSGQSHMQISESGNSISTTGIGANGIRVEGNVQWITVDGNIETTGADAHGIYLGEGGGGNRTGTIHVMANGGITTSGETAHALSVHGSVTNLSIQGTLSAQGQDAEAIHRRLDSNVPQQTETAPENGPPNTPLEPAPPLPPPPPPPAEPVAPAAPTPPSTEEPVAGSVEEPAAPSAPTTPTPPRPPLQVELKPGTMIRGQLADDIRLASNTPIIVGGDGSLLTVDDLTDVAMTTGIIAQGINAAHDSAHQRLTKLAVQPTLSHRWGQIDHRSGKQSAVRDGMAWKQEQTHVILGQDVHRIENGRMGFFGGFGSGKANTSKQAKHRQDSENLFAGVYFHVRRGGDTDNGNGEAQMRRPMSNVAVSTVIGRQKLKSKRTGFLEGKGETTGNYISSSVGVGYIMPGVFGASHKWDARFRGRLSLSNMSVDRTEGSNDLDYASRNVGVAQGDVRVGVGMQEKGMDFEVNVGHSIRSLSNNNVLVSYKDGDHKRFGIPGPSGTGSTSIGVELNKTMPGDYGLFFRANETFGDISTTTVNFGVRMKM